MASLTVIWWRDIPAQIVAREGRQTAKVVLDHRFQAAIDAAATRAELGDMDAYLAEWRRVERACGPDLEAEVAAEAARLDAAYSKARLAELTSSGGLAVTDGVAATGGLAATGGMAATHDATEAP